MYDFRITGIDRNYKAKLFSINTKKHLSKSVDPELLIPFITSKENSPSPKKIKTKRKESNVEERNRAKIFNINFENLVAEDCWLNDEHIELALGLLSKKYPSIYFQTIYNFQWNYLQKIYKTEGKFIQILNIGNNHWITICHVENNPFPVIHIYDSLYKNFKTLTSDSRNTLLKQIALMLNGSHSFFTLRWADIQQQTDSSSCGLFAIANATALSENKNPCEYIWRVDEMRKHTSDCFNSEDIKLYPFSTDSRQHVPELQSNQINVCQNCMLPILLDFKKCNEQIHKDKCCDVADMCDSCK